MTKIEIGGGEPDPDEGELVGFRVCRMCGELFVGFRDVPCAQCTKGR